MTLREHNEISRRGLFRMGAIAGTLIVGSGIALDAAPAAEAAQHLWRWCYRCSGLWFSGNGTSGGCPAGGGHDGSRSGDYDLKFDTDGGQGQAGWVWCGFCQGLWFGATFGFGACPARSDGHSIGRIDTRPPQFSGNYLLEYVGFTDGPGGQPQWRQCGKCYGLFFDGNTPGASGVCPQDHGRHSTAGTKNYVLREL